MGIGSCICGCVDRRSGLVWWCCQIIDQVRCHVSLINRDKTIYIEPSTKEGGDGVFVQSKDDTELVLGLL